MPMKTRGSSDGPWLPNFLLYRSKLKGGISISRAYLFEVSPVPVFELEQVEEDGERRLAQLRVRHESHLEERTDYSWNGQETDW